MFSCKWFEFANGLCVSILMSLVLGGRSACGSTAGLPAPNYPSVTFTSQLQSGLVENPVLKSGVMGDWNQLDSACQYLSQAELDIDSRGNIGGIVIFTSRQSISTRHQIWKNDARGENPATVSINNVDGTSEVYASNPANGTLLISDAKPKSSFIEHQNGLLSVMITEDFINSHQAGKSFDLYQLDDVTMDKPSYWITLFLGCAILCTLLYRAWYKSA
jgi:hypothetical protein